MKRKYRAAIRVALGTAALCLAWTAVAQGQAPTLEGQPVVEVRVVDEAGQALEKISTGLPLAPGQSFQMEAERESLRKLYRSGRYADIHAEAAPVAGGLRVDFVVRRNFYNNVVRVEGLREPPSEAWALAAMRLNLGEPFRESAVREALGRLLETLREQGFYRAALAYNLTPHEDTRQMDVIVRVTPGPRARAGSIEVRNRTEFPDRELLRCSKLATGKEITAARLDRAAERVRKFLVGTGYLGARAVVRRGEYNPQANVLPLVLGVAAGPQVRVEVTGARVSKSQLRKLLPIYAEGSVDEDLLQEGRRNLRDLLERDGFFDAQVQYATRQESAGGARGEQVITYQVERGPRHRLRGVSIDGNRYFGGALLRSRLQIQPAAFDSRGRFSQRLLQSDVDSIRDLYLSNGFRDVQVRSEVLNPTGVKERDLFVKIHIAEGTQARVAALAIEGNRALRDDTLLSVVGSTPGQPFSDANVTTDRDNILALYYNEGFPEARFNAQVSDASEPNRVRLTYRITEGTQVRVDRVLLTGYEYTRPRVVAREVRVTPDGPLREGDVIESQRRLYNLGIFNRVTIAPQNPAGADPEKAVVVEVNEGKRYTLGYGGGFEVQRLGGAGTSPVGGTLSASPRVIFEITKANVGGRAQTASFKVRASTLQYRGLLSYSAPNILSRPHFDLLLTGFVDKSRDVRTFTSTRYEGSLQLVQNLSPASSLIYRYSYRHVIVNANSLRIPADEVPLFSQPTRISAVGITAVRDRRDNPADAARGNFNTADVSLATKTIGSSASFLRFFMQNSTYHPIGRALVFARSVRFGVEQTIGQTSEIQIPLPERFFAGGGTSLRGFGLNQAGPRDFTSGFPLGGLALLVFNQELRFPMRLPLVGNRVGGAIFYDAGNVFTDASKITLRLSPPPPPASCTQGTRDLKCSNLNYFSHTIGFGFRYGTPIGPVRLDLGYQLNPARFTFFNSANTQVSTRLPRFQFFFNIGSIF